MTLKKPSIIKGIALSAIVRIFGALLIVVKYTSRTARSRSMSPSKSVLGIDAGPNGWRLIEYEELLTSAYEFFGADHVKQLIVLSPKNYARDLIVFLKTSQLTHYIYDPRTGSQSFFGGTIQAIMIAFILKRYGVTPIARVVDLPVRRWRLQSSLVTAADGVCIILMETWKNRRWLAHRRHVGPLYMPISNGTLVTLGELREDHDSVASATCVSFIGSLYEPRTSYLLCLKEILSVRGIELKLIVRNMSEPRGPNAAYWRNLRKEGIVITTAEQSHAPEMDLIGPSLMYRCTEVLATGSLLVAPVAGGIEAFFTPGVDFLPCDDPGDAADQIEWALSNLDDRRRIADSGFHRIRTLAAAYTFWRMIDSALGVDGFVRSE